MQMLLNQSLSEDHHIPALVSSNVMSLAAVTLGRKGSGAKYIIAVSHKEETRSPLLRQQRRKNLLLMRSTLCVPSCCLLFTLLQMKLTLGSRTSGGPNKLGGGGLKKFFR